MLLAVLLPIVQPIILSFASPENFFLALAGIAFIAVLSSGAPRKGLIAGVLGIFMSLFGYSPTEGVPRFWLGIDYMLDGFRLVPLAMGLFAVPEILALMTSGKTIARADASDGSRFRSARWSRAGSRCSSTSACSSGPPAIGSVIGIMPGVGGSTAPVRRLCRGQADLAQPGELRHRPHRRRDRAGKLQQRQGGRRAGADAGARHSGQRLDGADARRLHHSRACSRARNFSSSISTSPSRWRMVLAFGNVGSSVLMFLLSKSLIYVTRVPGHVLAPILLVLVMHRHLCGREQRPIDVLFVFIFGVLGVTMERLDYNRPALLLGFVLGETIERYYQVSINAYGRSVLPAADFARHHRAGAGLPDLAEPQAHRAAVEARMTRAEAIFPALLIVDRGDPAGAGQFRL